MLLQWMDEINHANTQVPASKRRDAATSAFQRIKFNLIGHRRLESQLNDTISSGHVWLNSATRCLEYKVRPSKTFKASVKRLTPVYISSMSSWHGR